MKIDETFVEVYTENVWDRRYRVLEKNGRFLIQSWGTMSLWSRLWGGPTHGWLTQVDADLGACQFNVPHWWDRVCLYPTKEAAMHWIAGQSVHVTM